MHFAERQRGVAWLYCFPWCMGILNICPASLQPMPTLLHSVLWDWVSAGSISHLLSASSILLMGEALASDQKLSASDSNQRLLGVFIWTISESGSPSQFQTKLQWYFSGLATDAHCVVSISAAEIGSRALVQGAYATCHLSIASSFRSPEES